MGYVLALLEFGVGEKKGFGALGVEVDFDLVVLRHLVTIDTHDGSFAEDTMGDSIGGFPNGNHL